MGCFWDAGNVLDPDLVHVYVPTYQFVYLTVCELYPN